MNHVTEKKLNNKGFSLVELIIVIAIMAVLIGVLAPQYLKYVEKSRESADLDAVDSMVSAIEIYSADPANSVVEGTLKSTAGVITTAAAGAGGTDVVGAALTDAGISVPTSKLMKSKKYQNWTITFSTTGMTFSTGDGGDALKTALGH